MKPWNVVVDGRQYEIKSKGSSLLVNGEKVKLKNLMSKKTVCGRFMSFLWDRKRQNFTSTPGLADAR